MGGLQNSGVRRHIRRLDLQLRFRQRLTGERKGIKAKSGERCCLRCIDLPFMQEEEQKETRLPTVQSKIVECDWLSFSALPPVPTRLRALQNSTGEVSEGAAHSPATLLSALQPDVDQE